MSERYVDSVAFAWRSDCYATVNASRDPRLRLVSRKQRDAITEVVMREWDVLANTTGAGPSDHFRPALRERVRASLKRKQWSFPWLPVIMLVAEIIIKILLERWSNDREERA